MRLNSIRILLYIFFNMSIAKGFLRASVELSKVIGIQDVKRTDALKKVFSIYSDFKLTP